MLRGRAPFQKVALVLMLLAVATVIVHLASPYPVRMRVQDPTEDLFRVGESAVVIIRGN